MSTLHTLSIAVRIAVLLLLAGLAVWDVRERRLPNSAVAALGLSFFLCGALSHMAWTTVLAHFGLGVLVLLICAALLYLNLLGGGDAKFAAVMFLWSGPALAVVMLTVMSVAGTLVGVLSFLTRRLDPAHTRGLLRPLALLSAVRGVPYGVAIAAGGVCIVAWPWVLPWILSTISLHPPMR